MAVQESIRPQPVKTTDQRRPVRQALAATAASLGLLAGVVAAGAALSGTWSVSAAWNRAVATVTALPEYRVALSLFEDGSSADFARDLLGGGTGFCRRGGEPVFPAGPGPAGNRSGL